MGYIIASSDLPGTLTVRVSTSTAHPERRRVAPKSKDCVVTPMPAMPFDFAPRGLRSGRTKKKGGIHLPASRSGRMGWVGVPRVPA